ncbi:MAG: M48 family metalloprotease [Patescibacteria group bacterium]|nr:M48 family metalloprotease [Patescibacteria group bacterium]
MNHEQNCEQIFEEACRVLKLRGFLFKPKVIRKGDGYVKNYKFGYTNLKSKLVVVDIYTQKLKKPKKYSSILAVIAHELAHHQKKPYRQLYKFHWINRIHYPEFYDQVAKNIRKFKRDGVLTEFYK